MVFVSWTAPGVQFETREALNEHYRSDWHNYNLKRRVNGLPVVPLVVFQKLQMISEERERKKTELVKGTDHLKYAAKRDAATLALKRVSSGSGEGKSMKAGTDEADRHPKEDKKSEELDLEDLKKPIDEKVCFMDGHVSESFEENLLHLYKTYGFFVPDTNYCIDLPGLFTYCTKKVQVGRICLYCQKGFSTRGAVIHHMTDKGHCKLPWQNEEDFEEYDEFFDYSTIPYDMRMKFSEDPEGSDNENETEAYRSTKQIEVMDTGELLLTDTGSGQRKIIGHRAFKNVYKQKLRVKEETRPAFLANSNEKLLLAYKRAGIDTESALAKPYLNAGRPEWMDKTLARHQWRTQRYESKLKLRDSVQINLQIKNRQHQKKQMGAGFGVHG